MEAVVVKAEERKALDVYSGNVSVSCAAPPEVVYDILADLRTHVVWGGQTNRMHQRLLTIEAPDEPATVGTTFQSVQGPVKFNSLGENGQAAAFVFQWQHGVETQVLPTSAAGSSKVEYPKAPWGG